MKKFLIAIAAILLITVCAKTTSDQAAILAVIQANLKAMENEDVEATMATIDPSSTAYAMTQEMIKVIFDQYDLKYEISGLKVLKTTDQEAEVAFTQVTRKVSGPDFRNNKIQGIHTLRKVNGAWKIFASRIVKTTYLD